MLQRGAGKRQTVIDSLPVPVVQLHLAPAARGDGAAHGAHLGKVASKQQTIYGFKRHLLVPSGGVILDFVLAPANEADLVVGTDLLAEHTNLTVYGDKAYISALVAELLARNRVRVIAAARQIIETVNEQRTAQFTIERNHAHSGWGLCARLYSKLTAHTLCVYLNRLLGNADFLQIKQLAFPI